MMRLLPASLLLVLGSSLGPLQAQSPYSGNSDFQEYALRLRENALRRMGPQVLTPGSNESVHSRYPWKRNIMTTVFWVGELPTQNNPVPNTKSAWDVNWTANYGGYDNPDPKTRRNFIPVAFTPRQNPFYIALPYNDVTRGKTKPEAPRVIPWFRRDFERQGKSVCKGRWIAIRHGSRVAYAQWEDVGPFRTDHWQYVFGNERPSPNINQGAGLDISPAVRDYLKMKGGKAYCDWKFVEAREVPPGPWRSYGDNNPFVLAKQKKRTTEASNSRSTRD